MEVLQALRVDAAGLHLRHAEGTQSAVHEVEEHDIVVREVGVFRFADRLDVRVRSVLAHEGRVAGAKAGREGAVVLAEHDADPPGVEGGVEERGALKHRGGAEGGEREEDQVTGGGGHAYIVTDD